MILNWLFRTTPTSAASATDATGTPGPASATDATATSVTATFATTLAPAPAPLSPRDALIASIVAVMTNAVTNAVKVGGDPGALLYSPTTELTCSRKGGHPCESGVGAPRCSDCGRADVYHREDVIKALVEKVVPK